MYRRRVHAKSGVCPELHVPDTRSSKAEHASAASIRRRHVSIGTIGLRPMYWPDLGKDKYRVCRCSWCMAAAGMGSGHSAVSLPPVLVVVGDREKRRFPVFGKVGELIRQCFQAPHPHQGGHWRAPGVTSKSRRFRSLGSHTRRQQALPAPPLVPQLAGRMNVC